MLVILATQTVSAVGVKRNISQTFEATVIMADTTTDPPGSATPGIITFHGPKGAVPPNPLNPEGRKYQIMKGTIGQVLF